MLPPLSSHFAHHHLISHQGPAARVSLSPDALCLPLAKHHLSAPSPVEDDDQLSSSLSPVPSFHHHHHASMKHLREPYYPDLDTPSPVDMPSDAFDYPTQQAPPNLSDRRMSAPALCSHSRGDYRGQSHSQLASQTYSPPLHPHSSHHLRAVSSSYQLHHGSRYGEQQPSYHPVSNYSFPSQQNSSSSYQNLNSSYLQADSQYYSPPSPGSSSTSSSNQHHRSPPADLRLPSPTINIPSSPNRIPSDSSASGKTYSFIALPGNTVRKRPRRRYDEIERLYRCTWPDCTKAYGTLNHLNAHVVMQSHGGRRSPSEFKELRRQWRKAKKETTDVNKPKLPSIPRATIDHNNKGADGQQWLQGAASEMPSSRMAYSTPSSEDPSRNVVNPYHYQHEYDHSDDSQVEYEQSLQRSQFQSQSLQRSSAQFVNRLPPDSTLLTPLPGYQPAAAPASNYQNLLPPLMGEHMPIGYRCDDYVYPNEPADDGSHRYGA